MSPKIDVGAQRRCQLVVVVPKSLYISQGDELSQYSATHNMHCKVGTCAVWQYGLWSFQTGGTKLERFLHNNQHTQRKLLYFENWINGGLRSFQKSEF